MNATPAAAAASDTISTFKVWDDGKQAALANVILPLSPKSYKGSQGRVAVLGGSAKYTGAPFYAAMAALRSGSDLATVFTAEEAVLPIKSYSPELMVQAVYNARDMENISNPNLLIESMVNDVVDSIERIHCLVIGPGMGRCPNVMKAVAIIIERVKQMKLFMVFDADALFMLSQPEYRSILKGYDRAVLTPNVVEYQRLFQNVSKEDENSFENVTIVQKGQRDTILLNGSTILTCEEPGGWKRAGGIGDVLSGVLGTMVAWQAILNNDNLQLACWTACCVTKSATHDAFAKHRRAMSATHILDEIGRAMDKMESSSMKILNKETNSRTEEENSFS
jgi:ATP-dependent NAD(P)H-hydrate dehydratase